MKGLAESSPFHLLTNPHVINRFIFGHGVVIYYIFTIYSLLVFVCGVCSRSDLSLPYLTGVSHIDIISEYFWFYTCSIINFMSGRPPQICQFHNEMVPY